jgi:hypothetical protein
MAAASAARPSDLHHRPLLSRAVRLFRVLQTGLRQLFGWHSAKDYWFPDIRSVGGAIFVMNAVLYPHVYITARASLLAQSALTSRLSTASAEGTLRRGALDKSIKSGAGLAISGQSG